MKDKMRKGNKNWFTKDEIETENALDSEITPEMMDRINDI